LSALAEFAATDGSGREDQVEMVVRIGCVPVQETYVG